MLGGTPLVGSTLDPQFLSTVFAVTTLIATGLSGLTWGLVKTLRDTSNDLRNRVRDLEDERAADAAELQEVKSQNALLRTMVTGEAHWQAITDLLEHHHREAQTVWGKILPAVSHIEEILVRVERAPSSSPTKGIGDGSRDGP